MLTFEEENSLLDDIREGVALAVSEEGLEDEGYVDDIKLNKLAYFAIQEYNLDITYGWYKYGPAPYFEDAASRGSTHTVQPETPDQLQASDKPRIPTVDNSYLSPEAYCYYFAQDIQDEFHKIVITDTKTYLEEFYEEFAPSKYKDLYKESVRLQRTLDEMKNSDSWLEEVDQYYNDVEEGFENTYREMLLLDEVGEAVPPFREYRQLLKNTIIGMKERDEITPSQQKFLTEVISFFYGATWEYTALFISRDTVVGANSAELKTSIEAKLQYYRNNYERELDSLRKRARGFRLEPDAVEEQREILDGGDLSPPPRTNDDVVDAWTKIGMQAMRDDSTE